ncbi:hypothetical protein DR996_11220 [Vibrio owensii]|nr:hypothetical protein DR996_11220 [Vibrio owensii]
MQDQGSERIARLWIGVDRILRIPFIIVLLCQLVLINNITVLLVNLYLRSDFFNFFFIIDLAVFVISKSYIDGKRGRIYAIFLHASLHLLGIISAFYSVEIPAHGNA